MTPVTGRCRQEDELFSVFLGYVRSCLKKTNGYRRSSLGDNRKLNCTKTVFKVPIKTMKVKTAAKQMDT